MDFIKEEFSRSSDREWLSYNGKFVARFKYNKKSADFVKFLIENFTQEEYFGRLANKEAPLDILMSKGFVPQHIKERLVLSGFEPNIEGLNAMNRYLTGVFLETRGAQ